jgi:hypothetical protein
MSQFRTVELCCMIQCSSGPSNFAIRIKCMIVTIKLCHAFRGSSGPANLAARFNVVQDHRTLLYVPMQIRTLELRYTFQGSSGLSDLPKVPLCYIAVQDSRTWLHVSMQCEPKESRISLHVPMQFRTLGLCHSFNLAILQFRTVCH